ncbi:PEP-CTERM sorting domain-containing protein [bacterium]|nr:MAG: PEP-CTERM sorting domain-containing protein [bacterium]
MSHGRFLSIAFSLFCLSGVASAQTVKAQTFASPSARGNESKSSGTATASSDSNYKYGHYQSASMAAFGVLKGEAEANPIGHRVDNGYDNSYASFEGSFRDKMTFSSPGLSGSGTLRIPIIFDGSLASSGLNPDRDPSDRSSYNSSYAAFQMAKLVGGSLDWYTGEEERLWGNGERTGNAFLGKTLTIEVPVTLDQEFDLQLSINGFASAWTHGAGYGKVDMAHSVYWGGIDSLIVGGQSIPFDLVSASGTNWKNSFAPVPEPASMAALGLGALGLLKRRRKG